VSLGVADKLRDVENKVHGMEIANAGERDIGMRRASGFNELYESVLKKEVELGHTSESGAILGMGSSSSLPRDKKEKHRNVLKVAEIVRAEAQEAWGESTTNENLFGGAESKWTWGVDLNSQDLWFMIRGADRLYQLPHSGYDDELASGKLQPSSPIPSASSIADMEDPDIMFDELTDDFPFIRDLYPHEIPVAFTFPTLHYMAVGESDSGPEKQSMTGSEYVSEPNAIKERNVQRKRAMQDEVNTPDQLSDSDSHSILMKRNPPHRPWLGPPAPGYV